MLPITSWRENVGSDSPKIVEMMKNECNSQFGNVNVPMLIERSLFSISQVDSTGSIVSHVSLFAYPNIPVVPPSDWVNWAKQLYGLQQITSGDSLFIHLITWKRRYSSEFLRPLIEIIFLNCSFAENILVVAPPGIVMNEVFEDYFTRIFPKKLENGLKIQTLYLCLRKNHFPALSIRRAQEKNHDDLWSLNEAINIKLGSFYGEFYFSDIISHSPENRALLTAKRNNTIVGLMSINNEVDCELLSHYFELKPFYGFHKPHAKDKTILRHLNVVSSVKKIVGINCEREELPTIYENIPEAKPDAKERYNIKTLNEYSFNCNECYGPNMVERLCKEFITCSDSNSLGISNLESSMIPLKKTFGSSDAKLDIQARYHPNYYGKINAFCIELLAVHSSYDEREFIEFFKGPFELYPDHDYCLISLPLTLPTFPLINHFVRCIPKDQTEFPHDVYVLHRNAALRHILVRCYYHSDFEDVIYLLKTIEFYKEKEINFLRGENFGIKCSKTFVFESEGVIIGFAIIKEEDYLENLKANYKVENFINFHNFPSMDYGEIVQFILSPIFHRHSKFIIREILRLTNMEFLFYRLFSSKKVYFSNMMNALGEMMPVLPRKHSLFISANQKKGKDTQKYFALYLINSKMTNRLSIHVNARIIIIGASTTALSFLESLIFSSARRFIIPQNITLVTPFGVPPTNTSDIEANIFDLDNEFYSPEYLAKLSLCSWINIVYGYMTAIDRKKKRININNEKVLSYDYLIITTGEQFSHEFQKISDTFNHDLQRKIQSDLPRNSFCINSNKEASSLMKYLRKYYHKSSPRKIIVCGHSLEAYATTEALRKCQYPGDTIVLVENFNSDAVIMSCFNDLEVHQRVTRAMRKEGIEILWGYQLVSWFINKDKNELTNIKFNKGNDNKEFQCLVLINCGNKSTNSITSSAIIESSLVYHNGLVIERDFSTRDPFIYGAGTHTRYHKHLFANQFDHRFYNTREVGKKLHKELRHLWNPYNKQGMRANEFQFLKYKQPVIKAFQVPGGNYIHIHKPGIHMEKAIDDSNNVTVQLADECSSEDNSYVHIHLNSRNVIEGITCYSIKDLAIGNIITLYGKHERFLNYFQKRNKLRKITLHYSQKHLSMQCPNAIPNNKFSKIHEKIKKLLKTVHEFKELDFDGLNKILRKIKHNKGSEEDNDKERYKDFVLNEIKKKITNDQTESAFFEWLKESNYFLSYQQLIPKDQGNI